MTVAGKAQRDSVDPSVNSVGGSYRRQTSDSCVPMWRMTNPYPSSSSVHPHGPSLWITHYANANANANAGVMGNASPSQLRIIITISLQTGRYIAFRLVLSSSYIVIFVAIT